MKTRTQWVLLAYRIPREPSTPRIAVWRKLRSLGTVQLLDGLVGLPFDSRNREQLEWLADQVIEAGGDAAIWISQPATVAQERAMAAAMNESVSDEYRSLTAAARKAMREPPSSQTRTLARLRRELHRVRSRDYFDSSTYRDARAAIDRLAAVREVAR